MNQPRFLYHGTSALVADAALREGLLPRRARGLKRGGNWKHSIESNPDTIYLTDAYGPYFAVNATETPKPGSPAFKSGGVEAAVIEIDVSKLEPFDLVPDEDVLEQAGRGRDGELGVRAWEAGSKSAMKVRTRWYRDRIGTNYRDGTKWIPSLEAMGTCGHIGPIPAEAISRVGFWDIRKAPDYTFANMNAMICLANYRFCGPQYKNLQSLLFDEPQIDDPLANDKGLPLDFRLQRERERTRMVEQLNAAKRLVPGPASLVVAE
jgi:hypothetical protein